MSLRALLVFGVAILNLEDPFLNSSQKYLGKNTQTAVDTL
jgi:hypothetical protein